MQGEGLTPAGFPGDGHLGTCRPRGRPAWAGFRVSKEQRRVPGLRSCLVPPGAGSETDHGLHSAAGAANLQEAGVALQDGATLQEGSYQRGRPYGRGHGLLWAELPPPPPLCVPAGPSEGTVFPQSRVQGASGGRRLKLHPDGCFLSPHACMSHLGFREASSQLQRPRQATRPPPRSTPVAAAGGSLHSGSCCTCFQHTLPL